MTDYVRCHADSECRQCNKSKTKSDNKCTERIERCKEHSFAKLTLMPQKQISRTAVERLAACHDLGSLGRCPNHKKGAKVGLLGLSFCAAKKWYPKVLFQETKQKIQKIITKKYIKKPKEYSKIKKIMVKRCGSEEGPNCSLLQEIWQHSMFYTSSTHLQDQQCCSSKLF